MVAVGRMWKITLLLNSANIFTPGRMDEINCHKQIFWGVWGSLFGILDFLFFIYLFSVGLRPPKAHLWSVHFPLAPMVCSKAFPVGCTQDTRNPAILVLAPPTLGTSVMFHNSPLSRHLWVYHKYSGDQLFITGVMIHFRYYINEVFNVWPGAAHALIGIKLN